MAFSLLPWDRIVLAAIVLSLGLSTGVASIATGGVGPVTGHTAFVTGVHYTTLPPAPALPPIEYGLATYRDIRFFGLWDLAKPVRESQDRMVFVWSADASDPRDTPTLTPTMDYARVRDRMGIQWTIYEFTYIDAGLPRYAYGVRVGAVHEADDATIGDHGAYNYVLVYRPERLLTAADPIGHAVSQTGLDTSGDAPLDEIEKTLEIPQHFAKEETAKPRPDDRPRVAFGLGKTPASLSANDPAARYSAPPSPPGIPDRDDL